MPEFTGGCLYFGVEPAGKNLTPTMPLEMHDGGELCRKFRQSLLESQEQFHAGFEIAGLPLQELQWFGVGQTVGVALWVRGGGVLAVTILLNGMEFDQELEGVRAVLAEHELPVPQYAWAQLLRQEPPTFLTLHPTVDSWKNLAIATATPALANAFFAMFGTSG